MRTITIPPRQVMFPQGRSDAPAAKLPYCIPATSWTDKANGNYWLAYPRLGWRNGAYRLINTGGDPFSSHDAVVDDHGELVKVS